MRGLLLFLGVPVGDRRVVVGCGWCWVMIYGVGCDGNLFGGSGLGVGRAFRDWWGDL